MPESPILPGGFLLGCGFLKRRYRHRGCWDDLRPHVDTTENPLMAIFQLKRQTNRDKIAPSWGCFFKIKFLFRETVLCLFPLECFKVCEETWRCCSRKLFCFFSSGFFVLQDFGLIFEAKTCFPLPKIPVGMGCQSPKSTLPFFHCSWSANVHEFPSFYDEEPNNILIVLELECDFFKSKAGTKTRYTVYNQTDLETLWLPSCKVSFSQLVFAFSPFFPPNIPTKTPPSDISHVTQGDIWTST